MTWCTRSIAGAWHCAALIAAMLVTMAACDESPTSPTGGDLAGRWQLVSLQPRSGGAITPRAGTTVGVEFIGADRIAVQSDCNSCSGGYTLSGSSFRLLPLACTLRACVSESIEGPYLELLSTASSAAILPDRGLRLEGPNGVMTFTR